MKKEINSLKREIAISSEFFLYMYADSHNYPSIAGFMQFCIVMSFLTAFIIAFKEEK